LRADHWSLRSLALALLVTGLRALVAARPATAAAPGDAITVGALLDLRSGWTTLGHSSRVTLRLAAADAANRLGVLLISQGSTAHSLAIAGDNVFRFVPDDIQEGAALVALLEKQGIDAIVPVWRNDTGNAGLVISVRRQFKKAGGSVASGVRYGTDVSDFTPTVGEIDNQVTVLRSGGAVHVGVYLGAFDEVVQLFNAASRDPLLPSLPWFGSDGVALSPLLIHDPVAAGFAARVDYPNPTLGLDTAAARRSRRLVARVPARLGRKPSAFALSAYDALRVAAVASVRARGGGRGRAEAQARARPHSRRVPRYERKARVERGRRSIVRKLRLLLGLYEQGLPHLDAYVELPLHEAGHRSHRRAQVLLARSGHRSAPVSIAADRPRSSEVNLAGVEKAAASVERLDELYREPPDGFVARRDELVKELRAAGDREEAERVKKLRRPTVAAWLINRAALVSPSALAEFAEASRQLEDAQTRALEGREEAATAWRAAAAREREAIDAVVDAAERLARDAGQPASERAVELVAETLKAATGDAELRQRVLEGRVERERSAATLGTLAVEVPRRPDPGSAKRRERAQAQRDAKRLERELADATAREERLRARVEQAAEALRQQKARLADSRREAAELGRQLKAAQRRGQG
jgi:ABC-type branched-subunit amino acid transport system substrate-binding protein